MPNSENEVKVRVEGLELHRLEIFPGVIFSTCCSPAASRHSFSFAISSSEQQIRPSAVPPPRKEFLSGHTSMLMEPAREPLKRELVKSGEKEYLLTLDREDFSALYPGMVRYILAVREGDRLRAVFRTNTFEYSPLSPLAAGTAAQEKASTWEQELAADPAGIFRNYPAEIQKKPQGPATDLVIIQGSPRPDGNCGILAGWAAEAAKGAGRTEQVIYPHDLDIHCCIGCYQCYNTGTCVFDDDMAGIIDAVRGARLLVVCSPVYTNTVPAGLKLVIDRMQAYHAERTLSGGRSDQKGILFSVAGRKGEDNFTCVTKVVSAFFRNLGIEPAGQVLIDSVDAIKDIRSLPGREEEVKGLVSAGLGR
jgi:multimeric flavodoxin WrbA